MYGFGLGPYIEHSLKIRDGFATAPDGPGHRMNFNWDKLESFRLK